MIKNNNPGNIRWNSLNNWVGQIGKDSRGFVIFNTLENGTRAMNKLIGNYIKNGYNTIEKIIYRYAPPNENNTESYIKNVVVFMNGSGGSIVSRSSIISVENKAQFLKLINSMVRMETSETLSLNTLENAYNLAFNGINLNNEDNNSVSMAGFNIWPFLLLIPLLITFKK